MIPVLVGIGMGISALYGVYKSGKAVVDRKEADVTNAGATQLIELSKELLESRRVGTNIVLADYGARKLRAFNGPISDFILTFGKLKNVEEIQTPELQKLQFGDFSTQSLDGLKRDYQLLMDSGLGLGAGLGSGAAIAFGAYNGTMLLATASTGTAISTLSGVAATNATLAWLGGGSLAAGGFGIAGGTMVLGGLVAAPALAIFGFIVGNKAEAALANALSNRELACSCHEEAMRNAEILNAIRRVTELANNVFSKVSSRLRKSVRELQSAIDLHGVDYRSFSSEAREVVFHAVKYAQLIKAMIDTPILDADGGLVLSTEKRVRDLGDVSLGKDMHPEPESIA